MYYGLALDDGLGIGGIVVSALGWATAIFQLVRVRRATDAVTDALETERIRAAQTRLSDEINKLELVEEKLARAIQAEDHQRARSDASDEVREWQKCAIQVQVLMPVARVDASHEMKEAFTTALGMVDICTSDLRDTDMAPAEACSKLLEKISLCTAWARSLATTMALGDRPRT